jgi:4'-phosphopantetheinyl transferase
VSRAPSSGEPCEVWWGRPASAGPHLLELLSVEERANHARLRQPADRDRYLVSHALLRIVLGRRLGIAPAAVELAGGEGKPRLAGPSPEHEFSLSHSGDAVVVAIATDVPVGVDVERVRTGRDLSALVERVLTPQERSALADRSGGDEGFYRYWVRKEAVVKATGHGMRMPLGAITVSAPDEPPRLLSWPADEAPLPAIRLHDLDAGDGHVACLATLGTSEVAVEEHDGADLLGGFRR